MAILQITVSSKPDALYPGVTYNTCEAVLLNCAVMLGVVDKIKVIIVIVMVRAP